jgi:hypothetical protein
LSVLKAVWFDAGRDPKHPPDPNYPHGIDIDISLNAIKACYTLLPYPAKRCGQYVITCGLCGLRTVVTTAGRVDDPRSIKVACKV